MSTNLEHSKEESHVLLYVDAAVSSSNRTRAVILVMITAAVLVFTATWNGGGIRQSSEGAMDSRIGMRTAALKLFDAEFNKNRAALPQDEKEKYQRAEELLTGLGLNSTVPDDKKPLEEDITRLKAIRDGEIRLIRVPFFGVAFDINDLAIFAGLTFTIVLLWLRFSLARELRNLKLAFKEAGERGKEQLKLCYELLAMHQVLSLPPMPSQRHRWFWIVVALSLYLVPALIYLCLFISDYKSRNFGRILNPYNIKFILWSGAIFLSLIVVLTFLCIQHHIRIDREWEGMYGQLNDEQIVDEHEPSQG